VRDCIYAPLGDVINSNTGIVTNSNAIFLGLHRVSKSDVRCSLKIRMVATRTAILVLPAKEKGGPLCSHQASRNNYTDIISITQNWQIGKFIFKTCR